MGNKKLKNREEINKKYKWNIEAMYPNKESWDNDISKVLEDTEKFKDFKGQVTKSPKVLLEALKAKDNIWQRLERAYVYARMKLDEDNTVSLQQSMHDQVNTVIAKVSSTLSFFTPELLSAPESTILSYLDEEAALSKYRFLIEDTLREKEHILSKEEENIIAQMSEITDSTNTIFTMLNNADIDFGQIEDEDGQLQTLTHGNYINFMESKDRNVRKQAYTHVYEAYKKLINTISACYSYNTKTDVVSARIRKYPSARNAALSGGNIPEEVYDNLVSVVHDYLPVLHKYISLRKKVLGVDELKMYDVYVPMVHMPKEEIPFNKGCALLKEGLAPLGEDYVNTALKGIDSGWVDVYENKGKTSGAYSFGSYDSYPYVLLNYTDTLQDVFTLVHEMGHSMHSYYTRANQPFIYGDHSIFTAEVASTVNESLLMKHLINTEKDPERKKYLINMHIEAFRTTLFRQTMFAEFENLTHKHVEEGGSLTAEFMCQIYNDLNNAYFGPALSEDEYIKYEWARIPHFYRAFYVYQYATGYSAATAISKKILEEGTPARDAYKEFLKTGSSNYPVELLKIAGVDMSTKEPVILAMETFKSLVDELERLL